MFQILFHVFSLSNTEVLQGVGSWFWGTRKQVDDHLFQGHKAYIFELFWTIFKLKKLFRLFFLGLRVTASCLCASRALLAILT